MWSEISKSTSIEPTRNYQQSPVVIVSENFDCVNEVITLIFEEKDETFSCYVYRSKSMEYIVINSSSTLSDEYRLIPANDPLKKPEIFQKRERGLEYNIYHHEL